MWQDRWLTLQSSVAVETAWVGARARVDLPWCQLRRVLINLASRRRAVNEKAGLGEVFP